MRRRVFLESPFRASTPDGVLLHKEFLRRCMRDSILRGEAPFASHLFYTQCLDDALPEERELGIACGLVWAEAGAAATVVYTNLGISEGMQRGIDDAARVGRPIEYRGLASWRWPV